MGIRRRKEEMTVMYRLSLVVVSIFMSVLVLADSVDDMPNIHIDQLTYKDRLMAICTAKSDITAYTFKHRDEITVDKMLLILDNEWERIWKERGIPNSSNVDMQRIVRDSYRTNNVGDWRIPCCNEQETDLADIIINEIKVCGAQGF